MARKTLKEKSDDAGLRMLHLSIEQLRKHERWYQSLRRVASRRAIATYAVNILEAAFLVAPQETAREYGKWLAQMAAEVNGFCVKCGQQSHDGLCPTCQPKRLRTLSLS